MPVSTKSTTKPAKNASIKAKSLITTSEIDDIFGSSSSKNTSLSAANATSSSAKSPPSAAAESSKSAFKKQKKDKAKKAKAGSEDTTKTPTSSLTPHSEESQNKKRAIEPETIVDPSIRIAARADASASASKKRKLEHSDGNALKSDDGGDGQRKGKLFVRKDDDDDDAKFRDSRGTGPRRRTEEGFAIYKEDELGMRDEGGDTPLCPFDCDCCF